MQTAYSLLSFRIGFLDFYWKDIFDILLVAVLLFNLYKLIRGSVALKIFVGLLSLYLLFLVVKATEMELLSEILGQFMGVGVLAAIILFQQELRKFLLLIGKTTEFKDLNFLNVFKTKNNTEDDLNISPIIEAMKSLGTTNTGALIVVSKNDDLRFFAETGDILDAKISKRLLLSIFFKNSPLHDGAAIIHKGRVLAARCILPVSDNESIPASLGLRHRAAVGMSEQQNDVVVLTVSEETGQLSVVKDGTIHHNLSVLQIRRHLNEYLAGPTVNKHIEPKKKVEEKA